MAISTAISIAVAGLGMTQRQTDIVAQNVARASQPGYTAKELSIADYVGRSGTIGLKGTVQRQIDVELQRQVLQATPTTGYSEVRARFAQRLDEMMGIPGSSNSLASDISAFTTSLQELSTSPDGVTARIKAVSGAQKIATRLNQLTADVQAMRTEAEQAIGDGVARVNELLRNIARLNDQVASTKASGQDPTSLEDARDLSVKELATWVDVQARENSDGQMSVFTSGGVTLVGATAVQFEFDGVGTVSAGDTWSETYSERGVGTITIGPSVAPTVDLIASKLIRSGKLAAYVEARDQMLVTAQNQLDALAGALADAFSGIDVASTATASGAQTGFDLDVGGLAAGNPIKLVYKDNATGETKTVTMIKVDDASTLPLPASATADPDDVVVGIDFTGGIGSVVLQVQAALGANFTVGTPGGATLQILDDGATNAVDIVSLGARATLTATIDGDKSLPLFTDGTGGGPYTGRLDEPAQRTGFAGRIAVNTAVVDDPSLLVRWQTSPATAPGDATRPNELLSRLRNARTEYGAETGIVTPSTSLTATVQGFADSVISYWGMVSEDAQSAKATQDVLQNNIEARFGEVSAVNVDAEMARLIQLQTAYSANARILQVAREMLDSLMRS